MYARHDQVITDAFSVEYVLSFDQMAIEEPASTMYRKQYQEREYLGRVLAHWQPSERHALAVGGEWSHEQLGRRQDGEAVVSNMPIAEPWTTDMASLMGEYKWQPREQWTLFIGARVDKHTYTDTLFSPRATLIYAPTRQDTFKLMLARSVRTNLAYWTHEEYMTTGRKSTPEVLRSLEVRYERLLHDNAWLGLSVFYHDHDLVEWQWNPLIWRQTVIGNVQSYGAEFEACWQTQTTRLDFSHGFTQMSDYDLYPDPLDPTALPYQRHSASPYGYGEDFASWSNHLSKLSLHHAITESLGLDVSAHAYWGYPGREDFAQYRADDIAATEPLARDQTFDPSVFLNLGLEWQPCANTSLRIDGHNLLGWLDPQLGKRQQLAHRWVPGFYRLHPTAITVSLRCKFH